MAAARGNGFGGIARRVTSPARRLARRLRGAEQPQRPASPGLASAYSSLVASVHAGGDSALGLSPKSVAALSRSHFANVQAEVDQRGIELVANVRAGQELGDALVTYARASARGTESEAAQALPVLESFARGPATEVSGRVALAVWRFWKSPAAQTREAFDHVAQDLALRVAPLEYCIAQWPQRPEDAQQLLIEAADGGALGKEDQLMLASLVRERSEQGGSLASLLRERKGDGPLCMLAHGPCLTALVAYHAATPRTEIVEPIFVGFTCLDVRTLTLESVAYLREKGPVGCGDEDTLELLINCGIPSFFSGPWAGLDGEIDRALGVPGLIDINDILANGGDHTMIDSVECALHAVIEAIGAKRPFAEVREVWRDATSALVTEDSGRVAAIAPKS